jgi:hypothetical protein
VNFSAINYKSLPSNQSPFVLGPGNLVHCSEEEKLSQIEADIILLISLVQFREHLLQISRKHSRSVLTNREFCIFVLYVDGDTVLLLRPFRNLPCENTPRFPLWITGFYYHQTQEVRGPDPQYKSLFEQW